jgi:TonB family protein
MKYPVTTLALLLAALAAAAADAPQDLNWLDANKRSAALIKEKGPGTEAADLARAAFDLYPQQAKAYDARIHAQLLLNLADARRKAASDPAALGELDRGAEAIVKHAGLDAPVLINVWQEAARLAGRGTPEAGRYSQRALAVAERVLGPDDRRTLVMSLDVVHDLRATEGYVWAKAKYDAARVKAAKAGEDSALVSQIDLALAKLDLDVGKERDAIERYRALVDRLEQRTLLDQEKTLQTAYAQLAHTYDKVGQAQAAQETRRRRSERLRGTGDLLEPVRRVAPGYPKHAVRANLEGFVEFSVTIAANGSVADAEILRSEPPGVFDQSAQTAIRKWKFKPKLEDGKPVEAHGFQRIDYKLDDS